MSSLFIEASAKTAVGVREAFQEVVERILDTPELWAPIAPVPVSVGAGSGGSGGGGSGNVDLGKGGGGEEYSGCSC
jgi:Ras-related protein Rab-18